MPSDWAGVFHGYGESLRSVTVLTTGIGRRIKETHECPPKQAPTDAGSWAPQARRPWPSAPPGSA